MSPTDDRGGQDGSGDPDGTGGPRRPSRDQPTRRDALVLLGGAALLAACGGGGKAKTEPPGPSPTTAAGAPSTSAAPPSTFPLTGMPLDTSGRAGRPAVTIKIDNAPAARPQNGLEAADLVFEEVVEGGVVRFAAVFHSQEHGSIGPVRSVRAEDAVLVTPLRGYFVYSGGNDIFNAIIQKAPVGIITEDDQPGFFIRRRDKRQPFNLYTSTQTIYGKAPPRNEVPPPFFSYRPASQPLGGSATPTSDVTVTMGERTTIAWTFDAPSGRWLRTTNGTPHVLEGGGRISFPNVVIQFCTYRPTAVVDSSGSVSPEAVLEGDGDAWVLSGPAMARGRWSRPNAAAVTAYSDTAGRPLQLQPGPTWVVLAPSGTPTVVR